MSEEVKQSDVSDDFAVTHWRVYAEELRAERDKLRAAYQVAMKERDKAREELSITEKLLNEQYRLIDAIPECPAHGPRCVPGALEWVREQLERQASQPDVRQVEQAEVGELLPCPFCGGAGVLENDFSIEPALIYFGRCGECYSQAASDDTIVGAVGKWNKRVALSKDLSEEVKQSLKEPEHLYLARGLWRALGKGQPARSDVDAVAAWLQEFCEAVSRFEARERAGQMFDEPLDIPRRTVADVMAACGVQQAEHSTSQPFAQPDVQPAEKPRERAQILRIGSEPERITPFPSGWRFGGNHERFHASNYYGWTLAELRCIARNDWIPMKWQRPAEGQEVSLLWQAEVSGEWVEQLGVWSAKDTTAFKADELLVSHWRPFHAPEPLPSESEGE